jgi:outer membrane protein assembly factor BamB
VVGDGNVYVASQSCYMNAFALDSGAPVWSTTLPNQTCSLWAPVANGRVYVVNDNPFQQLDTLYALNASTGATTWSVTVPSNGASALPPIVANGLVYLNAFSSPLRAYNATTGALLWSSPLGVANWTIPVVANATTGAGLWNTVVGGDGAQITYATVADGVAYVIVSQPNNASTIKTFHLPTAAHKSPKGPTPSGPHRSQTH